MRTNKLLSKSKTNLVVLAVFASLALGIGSVQASSGAATNYRVQPYTGGAPVAKVFYPPDGSTVTITATGAVVKQSPGHSAYREGWINPANMGSLNSASALNGQLASGATNPYMNNMPKKQASNPAPPNNVYAPQNNQTTVTPSSPSPAPTPEISSTNSSANANATASAVVAASPSENNQSSPPTTSATTTSSSTPTTANASSTSSDFSGKSLPNTGPGNVFAVSGVATILAAAGHFLLQRLRFH